MRKTAANARGKEDRKRMIEPSERAQNTWVLALTSVAQEAQKGLPCLPKIRA
jgi:hypothetical protein